ncbi:MAG: hypothetical protein IPK83_21200 [Planctomycetes bacterium]|nr:hypothetical protein [Planctomycetota bacterium]
MQRERLDEWVRAEVAGGTHRCGDYDPGHPWHYYVAGDNAPPTPYEQIPPCEDAGRWLEQDLPKNPAKRVAKMRELLEREEQQLVADRLRQEEVIAPGPRRSAATTAKSLAAATTNSPGQVDVVAQEQPHSLESGARLMAERPAFTRASLSSSSSSSWPSPYCRCRSARMTADPQRSRIACDAVWLCVA